MTARQITTAAELDALPVGSVMRARNGSLAERGVLSDGTPCVWAEGWSSLHDAIKHLAPLTLLHDPSVEPAPEPDDRESLTATAAEAERLSQVHAEVLATLEFVADRMDEFAYDELHTAAQDGVLLDEDGKERHVSRRHPEPVKPSREDVIEEVRDTIDRRGPATLGYDETAALAQAIADRVDALWPGRSVAEVKAEALREAAKDFTSPASIGAHLTPESRRWLIRHADRIERGES